MASLFKKRDFKSGNLLKCWYATWRNGEKIRVRSTLVPLKGEVINGIKETPSQARARAQIVADGYEAAEKEGSHAIKVRAAIANLANEEVREVPSVKKFLNDYIVSREGQLSKGTLVNSKTAIKLFLEHLGKKASMPISSVKRSDVKDFVNEQVKHVRKKTVQKYMTSLSPAFMAALDSEIIDKTHSSESKFPTLKLLRKRRRKHSPLKKSLKCFKNCLLNGKAWSSSPSTPEGNVSETWQPSNGSK